MSVYRGKDSTGPFYQWGKDVPGKKHWKKYYYTAGDEKSRTTARQKAVKQGLAAHGK